MLITLSPVLLGAVIAFGAGGNRWIVRPFRAFAWAAVAITIAFFLLPQALNGLGLWAFAGFFAGAVAPMALGWLGQRFFSARGHTDKPVAVALSLVAIVLHRFGDGAIIAVLTTGSSIRDGIEIALFVSLHAAPLVALFLIASRETRGTSFAVLTLVLISLASALGVIAGPAAHRIEAGEPWVLAVLSGLIAHILIHDFSVAKRDGHRLGEAVGFILGLLAPLAALGHHEGDGAHSHGGDVIGDTFVALLLETAFPLTLGLLIAGLFHFALPRLPKRLMGGSQLKQATMGTLVGAPIPVCSCGVLPIAQSLHLRGAGVGFVFAILIATPEISIETIIISVQFLGWELTGLRLLGALVLSIIGAWCFGLLARRSANTAPDLPEVSTDYDDPTTGSGSFWSRYLLTIDDLSQHILPWLVAGLVIASYAQALLPQDAATSGYLWLDMIAVTAIVIPAYVCASSATPIAAVFLAKGVSPAVVLVALFLGSGTNVATVLFLRQSYGKKLAVQAVVLLAILSWAVAWPAHYIDADLPALESGHFHLPAPLIYVSVGILGVIAFRSLLNKGVDGWLEGFGFTPHSHAHSHSHEHDHGHEH